MHSSRNSGTTLVVDFTLNQYAFSSGRIKIVSLFIFTPLGFKMCIAITSPASCEICSAIRFLVAQNDYQKFCARWVSKLLSEEQKAQQMGAALFFLERYKREDDAFLDQIVTE